eukprot:symbB.v1.2.026090.t1/scaffold2489.1/size77871/3
MAPLESQQGSDADFEEGDDGEDLFSGLLKPRVHDVGLPVGGNVAGTHDMAVGDDAAVEVGVQAEEELPSWAAKKIQDFIAGLSEPVDKKTVEELLLLLPSLPSPHGPRVLLDELRVKKPEVFERLYESMRRTKQRTDMP